MNELQIQRTPELIGSEIRSLTVQAKKMTLWFGIEIGRRLVEAKELVGHGEWMKYLEEQTEFSQSQANRLMRVFNEYASKQTSLFGAETNSSTLNNLSISNALRLLALPENEREEFAEEHDVEHMSARELEKLLKEKEAAEEGSALRIAELEGKIDAANEAAQKAENERADVTAELKKAQAELKELRERPVEVAVQIDEKAVERAKAETAAEYTGKISEAQKKLEASEEKVNKLKDKLKKAEDNAAEKLAAAEREKAKAEAEVDKLRKQTQLSNPETAVFQTLFRTVQEDFRKLNESLIKIRTNDTELAGKLTNAIKGILDKMGSEIG